MSNVVTNILNNYKDNPWITFNNISKPNIFQLLIVSIIIILIGKILGFSVILIIIIIILFLYFGRSYQKITKLDPSDQLHAKLALINPQPKHIEAYPKLISIIFDLRKFAYLSKDNFDEFIFNTDQFANYHHIITNSVSLPTKRKQEFDIAESYGRSAMRSLDAMIYSFDNAPLIIQRYRLLCKEFDNQIDIMTKQMASVVGIPPGELYGPRAYDDFPESSNIH